MCTGNSPGGAGATSVQTAGVDNASSGSPNSFPGDGNSTAGHGNSIAGDADAGMSGVTAGAGSVSPQAICGGPEAHQCDADEYCNFAPEAQCGNSGQTGTCVKPGDECPDNYTPVCGCDGKTYDNACLAGLARVSVSGSGTACGTQGLSKTCGGSSGAVCGVGLYCETTSAAACGQVGTCTEVPATCAADSAAVCGCDGKTYTNACAAARVSVSVSSAGACPPASGRACGGTIGNLCATNEFCDFRAGGAAACGANGASGTCALKDQSCTQDINPVCGCDGKSYNSLCDAAAAGVSVRTTGACQ